MIDLEPLSIIELKQLLAQTSAELSLRESEKSGADTQVLMLNWHRAIEHVLKSRQIQVYPLARWKLGGAKEQLRELEDFAQTKFFGEKDLRRQPLLHKVRCILIECLVSYMEQVKVPVSMGTLTRNLCNTLTALETFFPGYVQAGLLRILLHARGV